MRVTADKVTESRLFITSDLHLGHKAIIQYCNRPFDFTDKAETAPKIGLVAHFNLSLVARFNFGLSARFNFGLIA